MNEAISKDFLEAIFREYLETEKDKIFEDKDEVGDIAELGLIAEEIGEAMKSIRKRKGKTDLGLECADIIIRVANFSMRKGLDVNIALIQAHLKNKLRERKGLFIDIKEFEEG